MTSLSEMIKSLQHQLSAHGKATTLIQDLVTEGQLHQSALWAGHMTPAIAEPALLGQILAGLHNGNLLSPDLYPQLAAIEHQLLDWFCQLFGQSYAHFTHGSSYGNLDALWQARDHAQNTSNIVYGSQAVHYSVNKACQILGLTFQTIPTNELGQMHVDALRQACQLAPPIAIVATAGTSSCGAIDPLNASGKLADEFNSWFHIDAAWGGALMLSPHYQSHLTGITRADSVCFDPHKALGQPRPCSVLLYQRPLKTRLDVDVDYLTHAPQQTVAGSYGGELFLPLWCSLLLMGDEALTAQLNLRLQQAQQFHLALTQRTHWWALHSPTGIVCFRPPAAVDLSSLVQQGMLSQAKINGLVVYRTVFASVQTQSNTLITALEPFF